MKEDDEDFLVTRGDVEARFGISKRFLELAGAKGQGPMMIRFGRLVRYRIKDVRAWIEAQSEGSQKDVRLPS